MSEQRLPVSALDTPVVVVYLDVLEANIREMSRLAAEAGVKLRPHTKIHECPDIAKLQISGGACGIEVGTVDRAVCMAAAGIDDILIAHPFYGAQKLDTLRRLLEKPGLKIGVIVDMPEQARAISQMGEALGRTIPVLLKINTGGDRFGVQPGEPALEMARQLCRLPRIAFEGIYAHESGGRPTQESQERLAFEVATMTAETARRLTKAGIPVSHASVGASPTLRATCALLKGKQFPEITEIHPGHSVMGDMWHVKALVNLREACAAAVVCAVMSTVDPRYVVIDAGYKTFGVDSLIQYRDMPGFFWQGKPSYGSVQGRPDLWLGRLAAESACVYYMEPGIGPEDRLRIGDRLEVVPNNATMVISLQEKIYGVRHGVVERVFAVAGRDRRAPTV
ncbi:MAG TPA: alanine racemase [Candidatus Methylomirabilis sp.]|nr:alanine racemase [Candidatus Methylomirabilis sp.]